MDLTPAADRAKLLDWYRTLFAPEQVFELRALGVQRRTHGPRHTESGYFDGEHLQELVVAVQYLDSCARGLYFTLNPLKPELLYRRTYRVDRSVGNDCAKDADVLVRRWMLVDIDPVRASGIGATDAEKAHAMTVAGGIREFLRREGAPDPILVDSGNGYHLLYRVDLAADDKDAVRRMLKALAHKFDTAQAKVDVTVHNAGRICKLPGTFARKGDHSSVRPHRRSAILELPTELEVLPAALFELLAPPPKAATAPPKRTAWGRSDSPRMRWLDVAKWLAYRGVAFRIKECVDSFGRTIYVLANCPFDPSHADPDACVMQDTGGALSAKCFHNSCAARGWQEFKAALGAPESRHYKIPPGGASATGGSAPPPSPGPPQEGGGDEPPDPDPETPPVVIGAQIPVAETMRMITDRLAASRECYRRAGQLVRIDGTQIRAVLSGDELTGLLNHYAEVTVASGDGFAYRPLPNNFSKPWLHHPGESARLPGIELFTMNPVYTADWRITPGGYDPRTGIYYAGPRVEPRPRPERLTALLADFCFRAPADRTNYVAMLLTAVLMPRFIGSHPAALFAANQPGLGKSVLAQIISILRDGRPAETVSYNPNDEEFEKRLGAAVRGGGTTIIVDNAKGRAPRSGRVGHRGML